MKATFYDANVHFASLVVVLSVHEENGHGHQLPGYLSLGFARMSRTAAEKHLKNMSRQHESRKKSGILAISLFLKGTTDPPTGT